jgi:hypothetical protein
VKQNRNLRRALNPETRAKFDQFMYAEQAAEKLKLELETTRDEMSKVQVTVPVMTSLEPDRLLTGGAESLQEDSDGEGLDRARQGRITDQRQEEEDASRRPVPASRSGDRADSSLSSSTS